MREKAFETQIATQPILPAVFSFFSRLRLLFFCLNPGQQRRPEAKKKTEGHGQQAPNICVDKTHHAAARFALRKLNVKPVFFGSECSFLDKIARRDIARWSFGGIQNHLRINLSELASNHASPLAARSSQANSTSAPSGKSNSKAASVQSLLPRNFCANLRLGLVVRRPTPPRTSPA